uniref:AAA+ ATPase domain-containing protein n=1 Tax=Oryza punctata TaxID=4537 RepID=A0A0E0LP18_ORYPU
MVDKNKVIEASLGSTVGSAAGGNLGVLIKKLASLAVDQVSELRGISSSIEWLKEELQIIHAVLLDLSNQEKSTEEMRLWKNRMRELSFDIEDAIDSFILTSENRTAPSPLEGQDANYISRFTETIVSCTNKIKSLPSDFRVATEIQRLKEQVAATDEWRNRLRTEVLSDSSYDAVAIRDLAPYADPSGLVGIELPTQDIVRMITEGGSSSALARKVVAIVGFGGIGKTTLAKKVFDSIAEEFPCKAFVPVSRKPDVNKVLRDILLDLGSSDKLDYLRQLDQRQLIDKIRGYIKDKRYLVVVDDIWSKDAWRILKSALFDNNSSSRIIVTTRKNEVVEECCASSDHVYRMKPLNNDDSELLFKERAFGHQGCPPNLIDASSKILKKCAGSPLAILTLSGLLRNKVTQSQWEEVVSSLSNNAAPENSDLDVMRRIISFSYFDLAQQIRTCLLYLSIFPEDKVIKRKRLVNRWIAEGFIHAKDGKGKIEIGQHYFNELVSRSLIQPVNIKHDGQARACRVHDTILDFIVHKSHEENFITILGDLERKPNNKVRHLSIQNVQDITELAEMDVSHVRSLTIFGHTESMPCSLYLSRFTSLRVLDLLESVLPASVSKNQQHSIIIDISRIFHLKYVDIRGLQSYILFLDLVTKKLPLQIAHLQFLETLDLRRTPLMSLPTDIYKLQQLVRLFVHGGVKMPGGIGQLKALEELKTIGTKHSSLEFLQELGQLTNLRIIGIDFSHSQSELDKDSILISTIYKLGMCNLHSLTMNGHFTQGFHFDEHSWNNALERLRKLCIKYGFTTKVPDWIGSLNHLEKLKLNVQDMGQEDLDVLGNLHSLLYLSLYMHTRKGNEAKERVVFRGGKGFQCLKYLETEGEGGMFVTFEAGSVPRLENLKLEIRIYESASSCAYVFGIEHLYSLAMVDVKVVLMEDNVDAIMKAAETAIRTAVKNLPRNPALRITPSVSQISNS